MTLEEKEKYAKSVVNKLRKEGGQRALGKLKRGIPLHQGSCVVAVSLPCYAASYFGDEILLLRTTGKQKVFEDAEMARFMRAFDAGKYPHLEQPKTPIKIKRPGERKMTVIG